MSRASNRPWSILIPLKESQKDHTADRFVGITENIDDKLKKSTIGLVTLDDFKKTSSNLDVEVRGAELELLTTEKKNGNPDSGDVMPLPPDSSCL